MSARRLVQRTAGQVLVIVALMLPVLLGTAAIVIDLGNAYVKAQSVQQAADAAVLAGTRELVTAQAADGSCPSTGSPSGCRERVDRVLESYAATNLGAVKELTYRSDCDPGSGVTNCFKFPDSYTVVVRIQKTEPLLFGRLVGYLNWNIAKTATARHTILGTGYWVAPLAVSGGSGCGRTNGDAPCIGTSANLPNGSPVGILNGYDFLSYHHFGSCRGSSSSFCFTDLSRSSGVTHETDANDTMLGGWILNGYPNPVTVPTTTGDYGTVNYTNQAGTAFCGHNAVPGHCTLIQKLQEHAGKIILVPVFDPATTRNNTFSLVSFAVFRLAPSNATATGNYVLNPRDTAHWYLLGEYLGNVTCQPPPTSGGDPPPDFGQTCYGTPGSGTPDFGAGALSLVG